jgi:predicted small metal-binding protein
MASSNDGRSVMSKVINCECGYVVRAESDEELLAKTDEHVRADHPELVGQLTRDQILGMAEEE